MNGARSDGASAWRQCPAGVTTPHRVRAIPVHVARLQAQALVFEPLDDSSHMRVDGERYEAPGAVAMEVHKGVLAVIVHPALAPATSR